MDAGAALASLFLPDRDGGLVEDSQNRAFLLFPGLMSNETKRVSYFMLARARDRG